MATTKINRQNNDIEKRSDSMTSDQTAEADRAAGWLKSVSDPIHLKLLWGLSEKKRHVSDFSKQLGLDQALINHGLAKLRHLGLVEKSRESQQHVYSYSLTKLGSVLVTITRNLESPEDRPEASVNIPAALLKEVSQVTTDPEGWMRRPNPRFEGRRPLELLGTTEEPRILLVIKAAQQGFFA